MKKGLFFNTDKNRYFFDGVSGNVTLTHEESAADCIYGDEEFSIPTITGNDIKDFLETEGFYTMALGVTENCNLRCKYCVFSGEYINHRTHHLAEMDFDIAKKAIDGYIRSIEKKQNIGPMAIPTISFYGGEPLLNFEIIKKSVEYIEKIYNGKMLYTITTNATLLDKEKIDFLVRNDFSLSISLNGCREENDRLRLFANKAGTFDIIMEKLEYIKSTYPDYFDKMCHIIAVYDYGTDFDRFIDFFDTNELVKGKIALAGLVEINGTEWYEQYTTEQKGRFLKSYANHRNEYYNELVREKEINSTLNAVYRRPIFEIANRPINCPKSRLNPFTMNIGMCVPGSKIFVDVNGLLHTCEKVNSCMPLGTVSTWIDYDKIASYINKCNSSFMQQCNNCPVQLLCNVCFNDLLTKEGEFEKGDICDRVIKTRMTQLGAVYLMLEKHADLSKLY